MIDFVVRDFRLPAISSLALLLTAALACAKVSTAPGTKPVADASVHADAPVGLDRGTVGPDLPISPGSDAPAESSNGCLISCTPAGGRYCGDIGNGCLTGSIPCGACPGDEVCESSVCVGGPSCTPLTCNPPGGGRYCGTVGDGCSRKLVCPDCEGGDICSGGVCVPGAGCVPLTCNPAGGGKYCGRIGDGCGGMLDCGANCVAPQVCGGVTPNVCGPAPGSCTPITCMPAAGGQYCGQIGNGCGGMLDCGNCASGAACGTGATANVCPSTGTCSNLQCRIDKCEGGAPTSISGTVYDPAGKNPLYNVVLYVPNTALDPIAAGASCDRCASPVSGQPVAAALSDSKGQFRMNNVPSGMNVPLVIQIGKWRRQITLPMVRPCQDNTFADPAGDKLFRLPRQKSEGSIPLIALSTGHSDSLDCLMRKIGVVDAEFTNDTGGGRVHMYRGGGSSTSNQGAARLVSGAVFADSYATLFPNYAKLAGYDILVLQCEGSQLDDLKAPHKAIMKRYADNGGRIFFEHLHSNWIRQGSAPWPVTATWIGVGTDLDSPTTGSVVTTFPKGMALADWLVAVGASTTRGQIPLVMAQNSVNLPVGAGTQAWITSPAKSPTTATSVQYLTFNTPVETTPENQCGRAVFTDVHVGTGGGSSTPEVPFPMGCSASLDMTPQEKALEFMFFDLSSCVQPDPGNPAVPIVPPPGVPPLVPPGLVTPPPPAPPPPPPPPPPPIP